MSPVQYTATNSSTRRVTTVCNLDCLPPTPLQLISPTIMKGITLLLTHVLIQDGSTALHVASALGQLDVVRVLIEKGATVDYKDKVSQSCRIYVITVVLKNGVVIGI